MSSKYNKNEAKEYAWEHLKGVWAATLTPFHEDDLSLNEEGYRRNFRHWIDDLGIAGFFVGGKQSEFFSMTMEERKRAAEIAVEECDGKAGVMISCSDENLDRVVELARHAQEIGADYIVVHTPVFYFGAGTEETIYEYYKYISEQVDIGVALWNQPPDCGYTLSPELCMRLAELPNIVAIKYSVPRELYVRLSRMAGRKLIVSTASEDLWLQNIEELNWQVYLCSTPPIVLQTKLDQRINDYTKLAFSGDFEQAKIVKESLEKARTAFKNCRPEGKPQAHQKYWQELLGQVGGPVRRPLLQLTDAEKENIRNAFLQSGIKTT